ASDRVEFLESVHRALGLRLGTLKTFDDWRSRIHPEDFPRFRDATIAHLKGATERFECDYRYRAVDGSWRWARTNGLASRDKQGRAVRMTGATGDITELKERERELAEQKALHEEVLRKQSALTQAIVEQIPNAIFVKDQEGRFTLVNRSWT